MSDTVDYDEEGSGYDDLEEDGYGDDYSDYHDEDYAEEDGEVGGGGEDGGGDGYDDEEDQGCGYEEYDEEDEEDQYSEQSEPDEWEQEGPGDRDGGEDGDGEQKQGRERLQPWFCGDCEVTNAASHHRCAECGSHRSFQAADGDDGDEEDFYSDDGGDGEEEDGEKGAPDWTCEMCNFPDNPDETYYCQACGEHCGFSSDEEEDAEEEEGEGGGSDQDEAKKGSCGQEDSEGYSDDYSEYSDSYYDEELDELYDEGYSEYYEDDDEEGTGGGDGDQGDLGSVERLSAQLARLVERQQRQERMLQRARERMLKEERKRAQLLSDLEAEKKRLQEQLGHEEAQRQRRAEEKARLAREAAEQEKARAQWLKEQAALAEKRRKDNLRRRREQQEAEQRRLRALQEAQNQEAARRLAQEALEAERKRQAQLRAERERQREQVEPKPVPVKPTGVVVTDSQDVVADWVASEQEKDILQRMRAAASAQAAKVKRGHGRRIFRDKAFKPHIDSVYGKGSGGKTELVDGMGEKVERIPTFQPAEKISAPDDEHTCFAAEKKEEASGDLVRVLPNGMTLWGAARNNENGEVVPAGPTSDDVEQGELGNCWFLAAVSAVVDKKPHFVKSLFLSAIGGGDQPPQKDGWLSKSGVYQVRLCADGVWKTYTVDSHMPAFDYWDQNTWQWFFGRGRYNRMWVALLEKAYAKYHGSYVRMSGGQPMEGMNVLTGAPIFAVNLLPQTDQERQNVRAFHKRTFAKLAACAKSRYIMCASTGDNARRRRQFSDAGMVSNHAYSCLDARYVKDGSEKQLWMVKLRNPHGETESKLRFGDASDDWTPSICKQLDYWPRGRPSKDERKRRGGRRQRKWKDDGVFWMLFSDFVRFFEDVHVCVASQDWYSQRSKDRFNFRRITVSVEGENPPALLEPLATLGNVYQVSSAGSCTAFFTVTQPSSRPHGEPYAYQDVCIAVVSVDKEKAGKEGVDQDARVEVVTDFVQDYSSTVKLKMRKDRLYYGYALSCGSSRLSKQRWEVKQKGKRPALMVGGKPAPMVQPCVFEIYSSAPLLVRKCAWSQANYARVAQALCTAAVLFAQDEPTELGDGVTMHNWETEVGSIHVGVNRNTDWAAKIGLKMYNLQRACVTRAKTANHSHTVAPKHQAVTMNRLEPGEAAVLQIQSGYDLIVGTWYHSQFNASQVQPGKQGKRPEGVHQHIPAALLFNEHATKGKVNRFKL